MCDGLFRYPSEALLHFKSAADFDRIEALDGDHPWIRTQAEHARRVSQLREETLYIYNVFSPSMLFRLLHGEETFMAAFREDPVNISQAMNRMSDGMIHLVQALMEEGCMDGIYYCVQNQNIDLITDEEHEKYFGAADRRVLDAANAINDCNILHVCGYEGRRNHVEQWSRYDSKSVNWAVNVEGVPLAEGKQLFGHHCVVGGFGNTAIGPFFLLYFSQNSLPAFWRNAWVLVGPFALPLISSHSYRYTTLVVHSVKSHTPSTRPS